MAKHPMSLQQRLENKLAQHVALLRELDDLRPWSAESIHQLRVTTRRLTEILAVTDPEQEDPQLQKMLQKIRHEASELRDRDVLLEHLEHWSASPTLQPWIRQQIAEIQAQNLEKTLAQAQSQVGPLLEKLETHLASHQAIKASPKADQQLMATLEARREKAFKIFRKKAGKAALRQTPKAFHTARIAGKRLRYACELLAIQGDSQSEDLLAKLKLLQDALGMVHDIDVALAFLTHLPTPPQRQARALQDYITQRRFEQARLIADFFIHSHLLIRRAQEGNREDACPNFMPTE